MDLVANNELTLEKIPSPEGDLCGWSRFAHTINGYEVMGGFDACADAFEPFDLAAHVHAK